MINITNESIIKAIRRDSPLIGDKAAAVLSDKTRETTDPRLEENVREWIEGKEISDLWVGKYCINAIMSIRGDKDFIDALETMSIYLNDEKKGINRIWRMKA